MSIKSLSFLVLLCIVSRMNSSEKFETKILKGDYLRLSEHVYRDLGIKVTISQKDMKSDDKYLIKTEQYDVEDFEKGGKKNLSEQEDYLGTSNYNSFRSRLQATSKKGEYILLTITN